MIPRFAIIAVGTGLLASSCGPSPSPAPPQKPMSAEASCRQFSSSYCKRLSKCAAIHFASEHDSMATCTARHTERCLDVLATDDVGARPAHMARCASAYDRASCEAPLSVGTSPACTPPPGLRAEGAGCAIDEQCATSTCRRDRSRESCGTCGPAFVAGARCGLASDCGSRLSCGPEGKCIRGAALGEPCGRVQGDVVGCKDFGNCYRERCVRGRAEDEACDRGNRAAPGCDQLAGLVCSSEGKCEEIAIADRGAPCGPGPEGFTACGPGDTCDADQSMCVERPKPGQACNLVRGLACSFEAECLDGICVVVDAASCG